MIQRPVGAAEAAALLAAQPGAQAIGGGTELVPLSRQGLAALGTLVSTRGLDLDGIAQRGDTLVLGAGLRMADAARAPLVRTQAPAVAQALAASASPQVRNMATLAGNLMQRTRCPYFRGSAGPCHKREPGSGCAVPTGEQRQAAIFGTTPHCSATHASDLAVALLALDAVLVVQGPAGQRRLALGELHRLPDAPAHREHTLGAGELIAAIELPLTPAARASHYLKVRDRASFQFAVLSVAAALQVDDGGRVAQVRLAAGGVGTVPWRLRASEAQLAGQAAGPAAWTAAAQAATDGAQAFPGAAYKLPLLQRCVAHALQLAHAGAAR
ncbi:MAG: FAD binding domain-containing protein [Rubrivivax sp.]